MTAEFLIAILLLSPLLGSLFNGVRFRSQNAYLAGTVATVAVGFSFLLSVILYFKLLGLSEENARITAEFFDWIVVEKFSAKAAFVVDHISIVMMLIITGVGTLIHLFSVGYMSHDERPSKYFSYLNLFIFNMLLLVMGENLLVMFVGWEGVGLCSYLLIGFWFTDDEKAAAGMKAFITNRIGDAGFLIGIFFLYTTFGTISFSELIEFLPGHPELTWYGPITLACLCLFIGAMGKSAQIPLYVWLPDAMAGPTPVSALIHAATMVTAGVYMIIRLSHLFVLAPYAMMVVAVVGAATALFAATIGLAQNDIKKVLAYSTVSQLGYMFLGCGVGAFVPALFHLMTHAFFKALMFLGSGSVIHAMDGEQDIRKMGGLKKYLPITHITFFFGWLAIIGMPPFAGFFSKDEILWHTYMSPHGSIFLWVIGVLGAGFTAFYMTRLMALVFWGKSRVPESVHPHESPKSMTIPLMVLGFLSIVGGWIGIPHLLGSVIPGHPGNILEEWIGPFVARIEWPEMPHILEWSLMGISVSIAGLSAWFANYMYLHKPQIVKQITTEFSKAHGIVENKYFVDEAYFKYLINPLIDFAKHLWEYIDVNFIDRITYYLSDLVVSAGGALKSLQNGNIQQYVFYIVIGTAAILLFMVVI